MIDRRMPGRVKSSDPQHFLLSIPLTARLLLAFFLAACLPAPATAQAANNGGQVKIGVYLTDPAQVPAFEYMVSRNVEVYLYYQPLGNSFPAEQLRPLAEGGRVIQLSLEPTDWNSADPVNQPAWSLDTITGGYHDEALRRWAREIRDFRYPVMLRPMSEMNGDWSSWGGTVNGNQPQDFIPAWRHIHDIFQQEGAANVIWVWAPNRDGSHEAAAYTFDTYYPGDEYVDYIGLCGYNWGTLYNFPWWVSSWQRFDLVFGYSYDVMAPRTDKPFVIAETAAPEAGGSKPQWITETFEMLPWRFPRVELLTWFNVIKETDWRVQSSTPSLHAYRVQLAEMGPADMAANFADFCPQPLLRLEKLDTYWNSLNAYNLRELSVDFEFRNIGVADARNVSFVESRNTMGAEMTRPLPLWLGDIPAGEARSFTLSYSVPTGVTAFHSINIATGENSCGDSFTFPSDTINQG